MCHEGTASAKHGREVMDWGLYFVLVAMGYAVFVLGLRSSEPRSAPWLPLLAALLISLAAGLAAVSTR